MMRLLALSLFILLASCASNDEVDLEPAKLVDFEQSAKVKRLWSHNVGKGAGKHYTMMPLAIAGDKLYAVDIKGYLVALDRLKGKKSWSVKLNTPVASGVSVAGAKLFVGTLHGEVIALSAADGSELWRVQLSGEILAPPQSNGSIVVVQTQDGRLFGLRAKNGNQVWMQEVAIPALTLRGTATPEVTDTAVYAGFESGKILALNISDGTTLWEQRVAIASGRTELERVVDINAAPLLVGDILYVGSYQGRLVALNRGTGGGLWAQNASSFNSLAAAGNKIFLSDADSLVRAYNATSGDVVWENAQLIRRRISAPQTVGRYVAVGDYAGQVHFMRQSDGEFVARRKVDGAGVRSPMLSDGDVLYVYGNSGDLEALSIQ